MSEQVWTFSAKSSLWFRETLVGLKQLTLTSCLTKKGWLDALQFAQVSTDGARFNYAPLALEVRVTPYRTASPLDEVRCNPKRSAVHSFHHQHHRMGWEIAAGWLWRAISFQLLYFIVLWLERCSNQCCGAPRVHSSTKRQRKNPKQLKNGIYVVYNIKQFALFMLAFSMLGLADPHLPPP